MAGRPTPTGRHLTKRHDHDREKNKKAHRTGKNFKS